MKSFLLVFLVSFLYINSVQSQVNAGPNDTICKNETTQLLGSSQGNYSYLWTSSPDDPTISDPTILNPTVSPSITTIYTLEGNEVSNDNLVENGDFEQGNGIGFESDYEYCNSNNCLAVLPSPPGGIYGIDENPSFLHSNFPSCNDHTPGSGVKMMVCNGDNFDYLNLYKTEVLNIDPNTEYKFQAYLTNLADVIPPFNVPKFEFRINDELIGRLDLEDGTCVWNEFKGSWNSGTSTSAEIKIINTSTFGSGLGNDFALDDVGLYEVIVHTDQCSVIVNEIPTSTFNVSEFACTEEIVTVTYTGNADPDASYDWDFGQDAVVVDGENQGPYQVKWTSDGIKDISLFVEENDCDSDITIKSITITNIPEIEITADNQSIPYGTNTTLHGTILSSGSYDFQWEPESMLINSITLDPKTINLIQSQKYYLIVTEDACSSIDSIEIEVSGGPLNILSLTANPDTICKTESTTLNISVEGGSGTYTYTWESQPPGFLYTGPENEIIVNPSVNTMYSVLVDDGANPTESTEIQVIVNQPAEITTEPDNITMAPGMTAIFSVQTENVSDFKWQVSMDNGSMWTDIVDGGIYSGASTGNLTISPVDIAMNGYLFRCFIEGQCNSLFTNTALLTVSESPAFISTLGNATNCEGENFTIELNCQNFIEITEFSFVINFDWDLLEFQQLLNVVSSLEGKVIVEETTDGISLEFNTTDAITESNGLLMELEFISIDHGFTDISWNSSTSNMKNVSGQAIELMLSNGFAKINPIAVTPTEIIASSDTINIQEEISVTMTVEDGSGDYLVWTMGNCNNDSIGTGKTIEVPRPETSTTYFAFWRNQCGQSDCISKEIIIIYEYNVGIPNAFTPNNDGNNDEFKVVTAAPLTDFKMQIYSRSNVLLFESDDQNVGWNGNYKDSPMRTEAYVFFISYKVPNKYSGYDIISRRGVVTLIR